jgi:hypothetical protein
MLAPPVSAGVAMEGDAAKEDEPFIPGAVVETTSLLVSPPELILNSCIMSTRELYQQKSMESSMPCKQMSLDDSLLALLWKPLWPTKSTEIFSMDPNSRLDSFAHYLLQFSAYYDVETACIHFSNITSTNELLSDQVRCSMDWSLVCEELSMSNMMTTTRRQSHKVFVMWKPPWSSIMATPISDNMDPSCRLDETALYLLRGKLPSTLKLPNSFLLDQYIFSSRAIKPTVETATKCAIVSLVQSDSLPEVAVVSSL